MTSFDMPASGLWTERAGWVVRALMRDLNLTDFQAAGLVGNLGYESGRFTAFHEDGKPDGKGGYGWAQWTASRRVSFFNWCADSGLPPRSDEANYGYLTWELKNTYRSTVNALARCGTLAAATWSVGQTFERPAGTTPDHLPGYDERLARAEEALAGANVVKPPNEPVVDLIAPLEHAIRTAQSLLVAAGEKPGDVDGRWGKITNDAYLAFRAKART